MRTVYLLMAEYRDPEIPLEEISERYFGIPPGSYLDNLARLQRLPVPVHRLGSQKSRWMVHVEDLARYIDEKAAEARKTWEQMQEAS